MDTNNRTEMLNALAEAWDSPFVKRSDIARFTKGLISYASMCGVVDGPPQTHMGKKIVYPKQELVEWMDKKFSTVHANYRMEKARAGRKPKPETRMLRTKGPGK